MAIDYTKPPGKRKRRTAGTKDYTIPSTPMAGTEGRGGITPLDLQREISALAGTSGQVVPPDTPGARIPGGKFTPQPPPLRHGVQGYVPEAGTVARLDPDVEAMIVSEINGPIDATLANLTKAHYEVFGSLPNWSLTADLLDSGEVEFPTYEEALRFFQTMKRSYATSGKEWQLDAQGTNAGLLQQRERQKGIAGFGTDSDVLDPEMLASWAPKSVEDFLFGPYMKKTDANRVSSMYRQGRLRLDEMLIELPRQWAISNLSNRLSARSRRFNPDRDEDEAMMTELNEYLIDRVPSVFAPDPTAAWQTKTEQALRHLQMMRASALYMVSGGEDDDAAGFLHTQGYGELITTLEERIRLPADPTGRADEERRAWVQDWWVRSRNPGISEKVAIHQLADLNLDMVTIAGQRQIGYDHLSGYAGAIKGWFEGVPGAEQVASVFTSDEFQKVVHPAVTLASEVASFVKPAVMVPVGAFIKSYEFYDKYADALQSAVRAADDSVLATVLKPVVLPFGWSGLIPGQPNEAKALSGTDAPYSSLWSEFFTQVFKDEGDDGIEWIGDFTEKFKDNLERREQGLPADYASEVLADMGVNPLTHPEIAFLATFALDSVRDLGIAKVAGIAATAIRGTERFATSANRARTLLHQESTGQMVVRKFNDAMTTRTLTEAEVGPTSPVLGRSISSFDKHGFVSSTAELFGLRGDDVATLGRLLRKAHAEGSTDDELLDIVRHAIGTPGKKSKLTPLEIDGKPWQMGRSGRSNLRADNWGLSYRMREKALLDPESVFYRGTHPMISGMFERLWSSSVVPVSDERLPDAVRALGFSYRTGLRGHDLPWAGNMDLAMLNEFGDMESITELRKIIASGDNVRYAGFMEGLYADSERLAERGLQMAGERVTKERLAAATVALRERLTATVGHKINHRMLLEPANKRFAKKIWQKDPKEARRWNALARAVDPDKPGDFVPQGLEHMMWEKRKSFERKLGKGEIGAQDVGATGIAADKIMAPHQGDPTVMRQLVPDGPMVEIPNEQSVAFLYDEVEPQIQAYRDLIGLDPDSGMPPGIIQEMAQLEGKSIERMNLELRAVETAHKASIDHAVTRHEAGIIKAMREKKTLDEQLELLNVLRAKSEARRKQLEELRAAKVSPRKIRNIARKTDQAERKTAAAQIEIVRSKLPTHRQLVEETQAKATEVRALATDRQGIKDRLMRIQLELQKRLRLESEEPKLMAEHALLAEAEQRTRQTYLDAVGEEAHWSSVMEYAEMIGMPVPVDSITAWRMAQTLVREQQTSWRLMNERVVQARIAAGQGRHLGEHRPRVQLRFYDPAEPHRGIMVDESLPAAEGGGTIKVPKGSREGATPLDVAVNVDLPESDMIALQPPPWVMEKYFDVLRRYGDKPAIKILQEWLAEQLYGYTKKISDDPRLIYSREQITAMTQQMTDAGYPVPVRQNKGPAATPRSVRSQPGTAISPQQKIEDLLVEEENLIRWRTRAEKSWLDAYQKHRLVYRDAPEQVVVRGIREAENILMERKVKPVELRQPVRTIGTSMRTTSAGTPHPVTYVMPTQRGMRESVRKTELYYDSVRLLDQRLAAVQARIRSLSGREAPYYEIPTGEVRPPAPLVAGTGTEAEAIATEQAGTFMERTSTGKPVSKSAGAMKTERGYEGFSEESLDELSDVRTTHAESEADVTEVEVPPNQALHDTLARIASIGYLRGQVTLRVPMIGWGVGRLKAAGTSPDSIVDAERFLTEAKLGARGAGEPMPLITAKGARGWHRIPEYETFTETVGKGKRATTHTYTRVKRDPVTGEIVWKKDKKGNPMVAKGPSGGNRMMEELPSGERVPVEPPIDTGSQGPRFERHEMYGQLTAPADNIEAWSDAMIGYGGSMHADPLTKTLYVKGLVGGSQIDLFNSLRTQGVLDEGWTITNLAPENLDPRRIIDIRSLPRLNDAVVNSGRKFASTYSELLGQVLDQMFADGRNAPIVANLDTLLAERVRLRMELLGDIDTTSSQIRGIISGVQDGSDTGGLLAGLELGISTKGRAFKGFRRQSGNKFIEGPQYEVVGTGTGTYAEQLRLRTIANIKDSDFTIILVQGQKKYEQVMNATVRGGGGTGLTMRQCVINNKPHIVVNIDAPDAIEQIRSFLSGKRGVMNVAGPRLTNAEKVKDVLVRAIRSEEPQAAAPTRSFEIVQLKFGTKPPEGVIDGHRAGKMNVTNAKPGEPGALGNPFVAKDAGGKLTREEAVAKFEEAFLARVDSDPEYRDWVLSLRGKKVGYYKPNEEFIHLQVVQRWLEKQGVVKSAEDVVEHADDSAAFRASELEGTEGPRELSPVEAGALTADELSMAAVIPTTDKLAKINAAQSIAHTQARSAEYRFLRAQRELRQLEIKLHASEQDLAADLARVRGGTARPLTEEDVENLRSIVNWLDGGLSADKFVAEVGKELDDKMVGSAAHTLWLLQNDPEQALRWAVQPSREWQLLLWADLGHNPARLAKFLRGGATRRMESVWADKFLFNRWSVDDGVTLYKTIVMAKISTMLRITMADEFTRLFSENMNPFVCLKEARALKAIDKLPEDIQFKLSEMIGKSVEGPMVLFDISHPKAWMAYRHILINDRRDVTFTRYQWGKQLTVEERAAQVDRFLATETKDANFVKMVQEYREAGDEFRAWYALGYKEEQGLRRIGASSHRVVKTGDESELLTRQTDQYNKMYGPGQDQYADARNLVDHLVQDYDWWTQHPLLGEDWRPTRSFTPDEMETFAAGDLRMPFDISFGDRLRKDIEPSHKNWNRLKEEVRRSSKLGETSTEELQRLLPGIWGHSDGSITAGIPVVRTFRDQFYRILDYSGSKLNEMVYASAFTAEKKLLMAEGLAEDIAERNAAFYAREYVYRVMFNNATYMGEDMLRNMLLFLPAYRQFMQYWVPYLATHPGVATLAYRANRDKDQFQNMRVGGMSFDLSRMSFLINQGDNRITGWLPSGGPLITMPISYLTQDADESSLWGSLAGRWPLEYAGEGMPLHSPLDKVVYGLFGKTLPWPFGSNGDRNPWRELQIIRAAELKGQRISKDDAYSINRMNRLKEGGWNFVVPVGMRFIDEDVAKMQEARAAYNITKTPEEADALLSAPGNEIFKTFIEWQNKGSWDQLQFLKTHPEIIPYTVSGFEGRRTNERDVGFLWSKLRDIGAADPAGYIDRIDEKVAMINRVIEAIDARKARDDEIKWWETYKRKHAEDHDIARLQFEWQHSEGEFAPGGIFFQQGKIGYAEHQKDLNGRFTGLVDPFTGITAGDYFDSDSYRFAKLMDEAGGHSKALLQLSPNYDMYVYAKLQEHTSNTTALLETWKERRMATRMTPQDVRRAGYSGEETEIIMTAVKSVDQLWDSADKACAKYGKYGYATKEGRAIRKRALEYQNSLIESSPLLKGFLGDNIVALYGKSYLAKPAYEREDLIRLDDMDFNEREAFYRVRSRRDENGRPMWNGLFMPEGEKKLFENAELLGYVPTKQGWMTKIQIGNVVGLIKGKVPAEGKQITLAFERVYKIAESMQEAQPDTVAAELKWLKTMKKSMPAWAARLIEDGVRAACWKTWLDLARRERHNLRTTINEYYSDAPGFSLNSKYGMRVKKNMLKFADLLGEFEPTFGREFRMQNKNNEMLNSILGWYL